MMTRSADPELLKTIDQAATGRRDAMQRLFAEVYDELRTAARQLMRSERKQHTLQPTALVNEAFLRIVEQHSIDWNDPTQLKALAAMAMRRVLIDHARTKGRHRRGGDRQRVPLHDDLAGATDLTLDLLALEEAIEHLESLNERHARLVELRCYGGLSNAEAATFLGVSRRTAEVDWAAARAWINARLEGV